MRSVNILKNFQNPEDNLQPLFIFKIENQLGYSKYSMGEYQQSSNLFFKLNIEIEKKLKFW
jgi:hypothetical protein